MLEAGLQAGRHTLMKRKEPVLFLDVNLETIKIEGEVTKSMKLLSEEKNEPKNWLYSRGWKQKGKIELILELAENFSVSH